MFHNIKWNSQECCVQIVPVCKYGRRIQNFDSKEHSSHILSNTTLDGTLLLLDLLH